MGYARAGFEVVGVDIAPQPRYPFAFIQADALTFSLDGFDVVHASPPCQRFSVAVRRNNRGRHPDLIAATRERLRACGAVYVIENVPRAPLIGAATLCGSSFAMPIRRHRLFESNVHLIVPPCAHAAYPRRFPPAWNRVNPSRVISISGGMQQRPAGWAAFVAQYADAVGIDWMNSDELSEAIPPVYTELIGGQLLSAIAERAA